MKTGVPTHTHPATTCFEGTLDPPWAFGGSKNLGSEEGYFGTPSSPLEMGGGAHGAADTPGASS